MKVTTSPLLDYDLARGLLTPSQYAQILKSVYLVELSLEQADLSVNRDALDNSEDLVLKVERDVGLASSDPSEAALLLMYWVQGLSGRKRVVSLKATYRIELVSDETLSPEFLSLYAKHSAEIQVWPYLRELANSLTSRTAAPRLTLSLFVDPSIMDKR